MRWVLIAFMLCLTSLAAIAQAGEAILAGFSVRQVGNIVRADFSINGGASCLGVEFQRYRADVDADYITVGAIREVCGGTANVEHYTITDDIPQSGVATYRLFLGGAGYSRTLEVHFVPLYDQLLVFPNPAHDMVNIRWVGLPGEHWFIAIYNQLGKRIEDFQANGDNAQLDVSTFAPGTYLLELRDEQNERRYTRRLIVSP